MSADDGVYILMTPSSLGHTEYRVAHIQAVDNVFWGRCPIHGSDIHYGNDGRESCVICPQDYSGNPDDHIANAREIWPILPMYRSEALEQAMRVLEDLEVCEYGISIIKIDRIF
jgi:hypothetical protein